MPKIRLNKAVKELNISIPRAETGPKWRMIGHWVKVSELQGMVYEHLYSPGAFRKSDESNACLCVVMALVTYILLAALSSGLNSRFHPEILGVTASKALAVVLLDFLFVKGGCYFLNIQVCPHTFLSSRLFQSPQSSCCRVRVKY